MLKKKCLLLLTSLFIAGGTASYCHAQVYSQPANDTPVLYGENNQIVQPVRVVAEATGASEQDAIASAKRQAVESLITKLISSSQYKQQVYQLAYSFDKYVIACHVSQKDDVANGVAIKTKVDIYQELLANDMGKYKIVMAPKPAAKPAPKVNNGKVNNRNQAQANQQANNNSQQKGIQPRELRELKLKAGLVLRLQTQGCTDNDQKMMEREFSKLCQQEGLEVMSQPAITQQLDINKNITYEGLPAIMLPVAKDVYTDADIIIIGQIEAEGAKLQAIDAKTGNKLGECDMESDMDMSTITLTAAKEITEKIAQSYGVAVRRGMDRGNMV